MGSGSTNVLVAAYRDLDKRLRAASGIPGTVVGSAG